MKLLVLILVSVFHPTLSSHAGYIPVNRAPVAGEYFNGEAALAQALGLAEEFELKVEQARPTSSGLTRLKLRVLYDGLKVRNVTLQATAITNKPCDNVFTGAISGAIPSFTSLDTSYSLGRQAILQKTADFLNANVYGVSDASKDDLQKFIREKQIYIQPDGSATVAYFGKGSFQKGDVLLYPRVLIANDEIVLQNVNLMNASLTQEQYSTVRCPSVAGGNPKLPWLQYGPDGGEICLNAYVSGNTCRYKSDKVIVYNANNAVDRSAAEMVKFNCDEGPQDFVNGAGSPASDAFYLAHKYYDMMTSVGGITERSPHVIYVHFGNSFANAFWDGYVTSFGDGNDGYYPFTVPDVIGHELCHAYTDRIGNSIFTEESVAIGEAFSDICGKVLSLYIRPTDESDWNVGSQVRKTEGASVRYFDDPSKSSFALDNINLVLPGEEFKAIGVYEKFFYLLVTTKNVDYKTAFQLFVQANTLYWQEEATFYSAACGLLQAAGDIGINQEAVNDALEEVGFDLRGCDLSGTIDVLADGERRENVVVSQAKNPSFQINVPEGKSGLVATVQSELVDTIRYTLTVEGDGQTAAAKDSISFPGSGARTLTLDTNKQEDSTVSLTLTFYD